MANSIYVVDNLVNSLMLRGLPPQSQNTFTQAGFIQVLSEEMQSNIVPLIDSVSEEYFVTDYDIAYVPSTTSYDLPPRAVGSKLRDFVWVDTNGLEIPIPRLRPEQLKMNARIMPYGAYLKNDQVKFFLGSATPTSPTYPTLRLKYIRRPSILLSSASCGQITAINGNILTLTYASSAWLTSGVDIIKGVAGFSSRGDDITVSSVVGFNVTLSSVPTTVVVGDWVAPANYSPIPQIPVEGHLLLAQYGACKVLEAMGDLQGLAAAMQKINGTPEAPGMRLQFLSIITPRVEGSTIKLTSQGGIDSAMDQGI